MIHVLRSALWHLISDSNQTKKLTVQWWKPRLALVCQRLSTGDWGIRGCRKRAVCVQDFIFVPPRLPKKLLHILSLVII